MRRAFICIPMTAIATRALNHLSILGPRTPGSLSDCRQGICSVSPFPAGLKGTFPSLSLTPCPLLEVKKKRVNFEIIGGIFLPVRSRIHLFVGLFIQ